MTIPLRPASTPSSKARTSPAISADAASPLQTKTNPCASAQSGRLPLGRLSLHRRGHPRGPPHHPPRPPPATPPTATAFFCLAHPTRGHGHGPQQRFPSRQYPGSSQPALGQRPTTRSHPSPLPGLARMDGVVRTPSHLGKRYGSRLPRPRHTAHQHKGRPVLLRPHRNLDGRSLRRPASLSRCRQFPLLFMAVPSTHRPAPQNPRHHQKRCPHFPDPSRLLLPILPTGQGGI